jgi:hypothetical protein
MKRERQVSLADRLRGIVRFLEPFQSPDFEFGRWIEGPSAEPGYLIWPHVSFSAEAYAFEQAAYDFGWVEWEKFDWPQWKGTREAIQLRDDPHALAKATPEQLAKLLTVCIRQDRFTEGTLQAAFETGLLTRILQRAKAILAEIDPPGGASAYQGKAGEFFYEKDGKRQDAALHEPLLSGDHSKAEAIGKKVARRLGITPAAIKRLYPRK